MKHRTFSITDVGLKRNNNEDSFLISGQDDENCGQLLAVADGMGGYAAGETASLIVCKQLDKEYFEGMAKLLKYGEVEDEDILSLLEKTIFNINKNITRIGKERPELYGMGSTLSLLLLSKNKSYIAQVGDSRVYRFRIGNLEQLSEDQTEVQRYVKMGTITTEEARSHHLRHVLNQAIGGKRNSFTWAATSVFEVEPKDIFLLCTDGLYDMVSHVFIEKTIKEVSDGNAVCQQLLNQALKNGGKDNVTLLLVQTVL